MKTVCAAQHQRTGHPPFPQPVIMASGWNLSRVRFAARISRALDRTQLDANPLPNIGKARMRFRATPGLTCLPLVGPELHQMFGVDKTS